ncbi:MAG: DUF4013 domain-containing protein [Pirellulaceae bacterium]
MWRKLRDADSVPPEAAADTAIPITSSAVTEAAPGAAPQTVGEAIVEPPRIGRTPVVAEQARPLTVRSLPPLAPSLNVRSVTANVAGKTFRWYHWPGWTLGRSWDLASLLVLLAVVAAIPILQFASLGYLLNSAANLAHGKPWRQALPGMRLAGRLGVFVLLAALSWLPVFLVRDFSYSAQLLVPDSGTAIAWRVGALVIAAVCMVHIVWAAMRGGRWYHFLWPAPLRFLMQIWRPRTWNRASDALYETASAFHFSRLWWLGLRGAGGAFLWTVVPVSLMIIGQRADAGGMGVFGFLGAVAMTAIMLYLPFLQIQFAKEDRLAAIFDIRSVRRRFHYAPWAHGITLLLLCLLCIPLYLLRIEATPAELLWAPSLVFVLFMLPAKLMLGAAMGYARIVGTTVSDCKAALDATTLCSPSRFG